MSYQLLSQRDPRWASTKLGNSLSETIGAYGCLIVSMSMLTGKTPLETNAAMRKVGGFDAEPRGAYATTFDVGKFSSDTKLALKTERPILSASYDKLIAHLKGGKPAIVEVDPPGVAPQHFVLATGLNPFGQIVILDPWPRPGEKQPGTLSPYYGQDQRTTVRRAILYESTKEIPTAMTQWTPTDKANGTRVRLSPDVVTTTNIAGVIPGDKVVDGEMTVDRQWIKLKIKPELMTVSGVPLKPSVNSTFDGYASATYMQKVQPVPPVNSSNAIGVHPALPALSMHKRIGVHTLQRIEEAREAFDLGCRSFTMLDNITGAREMRNKGAAVIVRRFIHHGVVVPPEEFARNFGVDANDTFIIMGTNEADNISTSEIEARFDWDKRFAQTIHAISPKSFVVIGSFSMGTPQLDNPEVAKRFRDTYAAFLNANASWCGINYHSYHRRHSGSLPPVSHVVEDPAWWPQRFIKWGYDPSFGGLSSSVICVSDETGVDIGGIGGFPACGYNDSFFLAWWNLHKSWFGPFPQVYTQNIFQLSPSESWAGYDARCILGGLSIAWSGAETKTLYLPQEEASYAPYVEHEVIPKVHK